MTPSGRSTSACALMATCAPLLGLLLASSCASEPRTYEGAFSAAHQMKDNADLVAAPMDVTWSATLAVLSQQGFLIQKADIENRIILATREMRDELDEELSYSISATLTLIPSTAERTKVMVAANQATEMHTSEHTWWHLLWLIPLFPTGTDYTTVVVDRDTVRSPQFYSDFLDAVKSSCAARNAAAQAASNT